MHSTSERPRSHIPSSFSASLFGWLRLLRVPNLLTVPGDVLAGYLAASTVHPEPSLALWITVAASLAFYSAGLILNDVTDLEEDRAHRPTRPLPSGIVGKKSAAAVMVVLFVIAIGLTTLAGARTFRIGLALGAAILMYTLKLKAHAGTGLLMLGLCRAVNGTGRPSPPRRRGPSDRPQRKRTLAAAYHSRIGKS